MDHVVWHEANEALDKVHQISQILDTGLDKETLNILIALCESGVNPEVDMLTHDDSDRRTVELNKVHADRLWLRW